MNIVKDMVSVIIPVYNREKLIEECVRSILTGSYQNLEIIINDDGSTDATREVCSHLADTDSRIRLITSDHAGVSAARNKAIEVSVGEYLFFIDSDDVIHPRLIEVLVSEMSKTGAGIGGTGVRSVIEKNWHTVKQLIEAAQATEITYQNNEESLHCMFCEKSPLSVIGGIMMRRDLVGETRFRTDLHIGEDFYFIYENLIKGADTVFLKESWYYCKMHKKNSSWDFTYEGFLTRFRRREMVWKSEEAFGRKKYADLQKNSVFSSFMTCVSKNKPYSNDAKKMRKFMKERKKEFFPNLSFKGKILCLLFLYLPATAAVIYRKSKKKRRV